MRHVLPIFLVLFGLGFDAFADDATARYQALAAAARRGDQPIDWQALRYAYAETPQFDVLGAMTSQQRRKMYDAYARQDYAGALAQATRILDQNYTDIAAHMIGDFAYLHLGDDAHARQEREIAVGLMRSFGPGDGHTKAEALTVISITEEYDFLRYQKYQIKTQALVNDGGHAYDLFDVERDGRAYAVYFLIDRVFAAENALLQPKP
jgi:hypothetical protein